VFNTALSNKIDPFQRVQAYIDNVKIAVEKLKEKKLYEKYSSLLEVAELYAKDAEYYLHEKRDVLTALSCIAYAEGLIDSLRYLMKEDIEWEPLSKLLARPKVLVAGSFEILHPGHLFYLREAWKLGRVYVVIARDKSINKFKKREPIVSEEHRLKIIESIKYVYKAVMGDERDYLKPVVDIKPDIILLGPDQWPNEEELKNELRKRGLTNVEVRRLTKGLPKDVYSVSTIIKTIISKYCKK